MFYIITGGNSSGKTSKIKSIYNSKGGYGYISEKLRLNDRIIGYDLVSLDNAKAYPFARIKKNLHNNSEKFDFDNDVILNIETDFKKILDDNLLNYDNIFIDEIGLLELSKKKGYYNLLNKLFLYEKRNIDQNKNKHIYITINKKHIHLLLKILNARNIEYEIEELKSLGAIIMASGESKRFGKENKLLLDCNGETMFELTLNKAINSDIFSQIVVVTKFDEIKEVCMKYPKICIVHNDKTHLGISQSIKLGVENIYDFINGYMFITADQPNITIESLKKLNLAFRKNNSSDCNNKIILSNYNGTKGSPNIFGTNYKDRLLLLQGDIGGKQIVKDCLDCVIEVDLPEIENIDIDYQEDIKNIKF